MPFDTRDHQTVTPAAAPTPSTAPAAAPGRRTVTSSLPPRSDAVGDHLRAGVGLAASSPAAKAEHQKALERLAERAEAAQRDQDPATACATVAALVMQAIESATALAAQATREQTKADRARRRLDDPFPFLQDDARQDLEAAEAAATPHNDAVMLRSLDRLALAAHAVAAAAPDAAARPLGALGALGAVTGPLGWSAPGSPSEAATGRGGRAPCAPGAAPAEQCVWSPLERETRTRKAKDGLMLLAGMLAAACQREAAALRAMLAREAAMAQAIATIALDLVFEFAFKAGGAAIKLAAARGAAEVAKDAATSAASMRTVLREYATSVGKSTAKSLITNASKLAKQSAADPRDTTVAVIEGLSGRFTDAIASIDFDALDDEQIRDLESAANTASGGVEAKVKQLVAAYRQNIEPIGATSYGPGYPSVRKHVTRAARIRPADGGPPRLALVTQATDTHPEARKDINDKVAAYATLGNAAWMVDDDTLGEVRDAAKDTGERFTFLRWMDLPDSTVGVDLTAMATADALDLPADRVIGLSLGDLMPARDDSAARSQ